MLGISKYDILVFFCVFFLGSWMAPKETGWMWAVGNTASCTAQGFFFVVGGGGELVYTRWQSCWTSCYKLFLDGSRVKFAKKVGKPMHIIIIAFMLTSSIILWVSENYNPDCGGCGPALIWDKSSDAILYEGEIWCIVRGNEKVCNVMCWSLEVCLSLYRSRLLHRCCGMGVSSTSEGKKWGIGVTQFLTAQRRHNHRESKRIRNILFLYTPCPFISLIYQ